MKCQKKISIILALLALSFDSVMRIDKKNYPQVYLEECRYRVKKIQTPTFIKTELRSNLESDSEPNSEVKIWRLINGKTKI